MGKSERLRLAWERARADVEMIPVIESGGYSRPSRASDFISIEMRSLAESEFQKRKENFDKKISLIRVVIRRSELPVARYYPILQGTKYTNHSGSNTFYNSNRGNGRGNYDDIDLSAELVDGSDYSVDQFGYDMESFVSSVFGEEIKYELNSGFMYVRPIYLELDDDDKAEARRLAGYL